MAGFAAVPVWVLPAIAVRISCVLENSSHLSASQSPVPKVPWARVPTYSETGRRDTPWIKLYMWDLLPSHRVTQPWVVLAPTLQIQNLKRQVYIVKCL